MEVRRQWNNILKQGKKSDKNYTFSKITIPEIKAFAEKTSKQLKEFNT